MPRPNAAGGQAGGVPAAESGLSLLFPVSNQVDGWRQSGLTGGVPPVLNLLQA